MKYKNTTMLFLGTMALGLSAMSSAATLTADAGWTKFTFNTPVLTLWDGGPGIYSWDDTFSFNITETSTLTVTDAFLSGDIFGIFSNSSLLGFTSVPLSFNQQIYKDYDAAAASAGWSTGVWTLLAGTYTISGFAISPIENGQGALRLDTVISDISAVPIPAAAFLFAPALLGFMGLRRKAKNTIA